jgi:hypothetical protein
MGLKKGQILIVIPFLIVFLIGGVLLSLNITAMARQYVKLQTAADAASRTGAYIQAQALMVINKINDQLVWAEAKEACYIIALIASEGESVTAWHGAIKERIEIVKIQNNADSVRNTIPSVIYPFVRQIARLNGADVCYIDASSLDLEWSVDKLKRYGWTGEIISWMLKIGGLYGILARANDSVREYVTVTAIKYGIPAYGMPILGKGLKFPNVTVISRAKPCWQGWTAFVGWHNPDDDNTGTFDCMVEPFPVWTSKLCSRNQ